MKCIHCGTEVPQVTMTAHLIDCDAYWDALEELSR